MTAEELTNRLLLKDSSYNEDFWLLLLNDYYQYYIDWKELESKTGDVYMNAYKDRQTAWESVFKPYFDHFGYTMAEIVYNALMAQMADIQENRFDKERHLDLYLNLEDDQQVLHFPSGYDLLDE